MASTTILHFFALFRLSSALPNPILVPVPLPSSAFPSPLLSSLPSPFPSGVRLRVPTPVPVANPARDQLNRENEDFPVRIRA